MPNYMIAYHGGKQPASKQEGMAQREKWKTWVKEHGEAFVNPGTPLMETKILTVGAIQEENDPNSMKGYAIIKADHLDTAIEIAKSDPFLGNGGTIRISQMMEMN